MPDCLLRDMSWLGLQTSRISLAGDVDLIDSKYLQNYEIVENTFQKKLHYV